MKKKSTAIKPKLALRREHVRMLTLSQLSVVAGGIEPTTDSRDAETNERPTTCQ